MSSNNWKKVRLENVCKKITDGSHCSPKSVFDGYPIASVKNLTDYDINIKGCRRIAKEDYEKLIKNDCKPLKNDVLVAKDGSYLKNIIVISEERDIVVLSSIAILRPDLNKINPFFLKYYFLNPESKNRIKQGYVSGSALPRIILKDFKKFKINLISLKNQEKIASMLYSFDEKIRLNNKMNQTLEEMAQAIFKHWFIDFEFPNENGEPYKSSGGEMVDSEMGPIPKGWNVRPLDQIADFLNGLAMQKYRPKNGNNHLPVLKIKELKIGKTSKNSDKCSVNIESKYIVDDGDIIFSWSGSLEVRIWCGGKAGLNQHLFKVTSANYSKWFYYYWIKYHIGDFRRIAEDKTTTMGHIKREHLRKAKVLDPGKIFFKKFNKSNNGLFKLFINNEKETKYLSQLRDALIPKLISGEIRVPINIKEGDE